MPCQSLDAIPANSVLDLRMSLERPDRLFPMHVISI